MFDVEWPWVLFLLPLPYLFWRLLPAAKSKRSAALKVPFLDALGVANKQERQASTRQWLWPFMVWTFLLLAISGPVWVGAPMHLPQQGRSIMLAVDLSGSMQTQDMSYYGGSLTRLQLVKTIAGQFIKERRGDRLGLILFGSRAYLQTPLTTDRQTVVNMLDDATIGLAGTQTAIGDAIGLSIKRLAHYPAKSRVLVLLTDGQNNAGVVNPEQAAKMAAKAHVKIYTIGLGSAQVIVNTPFGPQAIATNSDLDESVLQNIAKMTGGEYFRAKSAADLQRVYASINALEPVKAESITFRPRSELYPWPLALALCLSVMWLLMQRRWVV